MTKKFFIATLTAASLIFGTASAMKPVTLIEQGSFMAGGKVITAAGIYDGSDPRNFAGETLHGDHAYVFYQFPAKAKRHALIYCRPAAQRSCRAIDGALQLCRQSR